MGVDTRFPPLARALQVAVAGHADDCGRRPARPQRSAGDRLREALLALSDFRGEVLSHREKAWASITFAGARHTLLLRFAGDAAVAAGERLIAALPDHEFAIPGQLVADAAIAEVDHRLLPSPQLVVACELLLLEEG
jgi:hypothetical protein